MNIPVPQKGELLASLWRTLISGISYDKHKTDISLYSNCQSVTTTFLPHFLLAKKGYRGGTVDTDLLLGLRLDFSLPLIRKHMRNWRTESEFLRTWVLCLSANHWAKCKHTAEGLGSYLIQCWAAVYRTGFSGLLDLCDAQRCKQTTFVKVTIDQRQR